MSGDTSNDRDATTIEHDGACNDDCRHFQTALTTLIAEVAGPRMVITANSFGLVEYASTMAPARSAAMLRSLADAVERRAASRCAAA